MKVIILCLLLGTTLGAPGGPTFEEFEEKNHEAFLDPHEKADAKEQFAKHEAEVEKNNADYEAGKSNYKEEVEPWDDQTDEEFEKEKEGLDPIDDMSTRILPEARGMGLIITPEHERINTPEEIAYFEELVAKYDRAGVPDTWDSRAKGNDAQVSQSRFNPKRAPREDLGAVLKPNIEPKLDEYHLYFF